MCEAVKCEDCGRERRAGENDYNPAQLILRQTLGWYSGSDGEICGQCMAALIGKANGR